MDLPALNELVSWMKERGVFVLRTHDVELRLAPPTAEPLKPEAVSLPAPESPKVTPPTEGEDPDEEERSLGALLYSSGVDPTLVAKAMRTARARAQVT